MVPDKFNMVDMEGIDLIESQGVEVPGLYQKLVESIALCRYQCLYNWAFNGILIPPSYVEMEVREGSVWINEGVSVDEENVVHIISIGPEPIPPVITELSVTENGIYIPPEGIDGYNPVTVTVETESVLNYYNIENPSNLYLVSGQGTLLKQIGTNTYLKSNASPAYGMVGQSTLGYKAVYLFSTEGRDNVDFTNGSGTIVGSYSTIIRDGITWHVRGVTGLSGDIGDGVLLVNTDSFSDWTLVRNNCLDKVIATYNIPEGQYYVPASGINEIPSGYSGFATILNL